MRKHFTRTIALLAALFAVCMLLTACLPYGSSAVQPKIDNEESAVTVPEADRKLIFVVGRENISVNTESAVGYFCYEDNQYRILTDKEYDVQIPEVDEAGNAVMDAEGKPVTYAEKRTEIKDLSVVLYDSDNKPIDTSKYSFRIDEGTGYLVIKSEEMGWVEINAKNYLDKTLEEPAKVNVLRQSLSVWDIIMLGIGMYLLFAAITGKGRLYENEFVKEGQEKKHKLIVRITCLVVALLMIATGVVAALDAYGKYKFISFILLAVMLVVFITALLLLRSCTDQKAKKEAQEKRAGGHDLHAPSAAFDFDEDEPTVDDLKVNAKKDDAEN